MAKKKGNDIVIKWEDSVVNNITSITLTVDGETIDVSDFETGDWGEKLAGSKDWSIDLSVYNNPESTTTQDTLEVAMISGDRTGAVVIGPETPSTGDITYEGSGILSSFSLSASDKDDPIESDYTIEGNGAVTRNIAA